MALVYAENHKNTVGRHPSSGVLRPLLPIFRKQAVFNQYVLLCRTSALGLPFIKLRKTPGYFGVSGKPWNHSVRQRAFLPLDHAYLVDTLCIARTRI
jgi:hypothetical protein